MIGVLASPSRRRRWFSLGVAIGAVAPAVALAVLSATGSSHSPSPAALEAERRAFARYREAVAQAVRDGGFVVSQGMQPGVADIAEGAFPDETLVAMAKGWKGSIERVRAKLTSVDPPVFLQELARLYDTALAAYVDVGDALLAAAEARGDERAALIEKVPPLGERADELWDRAGDELDRHRARLGIEPRGERR